MAQEGCVLSARFDAQERVTDAVRVRELEMHFGGERVTVFDGVDEALFDEGVERGVPSGVHRELGTTREAGGEQGCEHRVLMNDRFGSRTEEGIRGEARVDHDEVSAGVDDPHRLADQHPAIGGRPVGSSPVDRGDLVAGEVHHVGIEGDIEVRHPCQRVLADLVPGNLDHADSVPVRPHLAVCIKLRPVPGRVTEPTPVPTIADYALLGNCQGSALVSRTGSIDWACLPRFDSPAFFARILGEPGGYWSIGPLRTADVDRTYVEDTMVVVTRFETEGGSATLTDFMPCHPHDRHNDIGKHSPPALYRIVDGLTGEIELDVALAIRPEFGLTTPLLLPTRPGAWHTRGGPLAFVISTDAPLAVDGAVLRGRLSLAAGQRFAFALETADPWSELPPPRSVADIVDARAVAVSGWQSWAEKLIGYEGEYRTPLRRSALVLRALNYAPTGAIVAAPTTSLPEQIGGVRNWDYRYTWVRDASFTMGALAASGCGFEATNFFEFFANATAGSLASGQGLQIMYGIRGERFIPEHEIESLSGHRDSRPVRIGNGAWNQTQLDVYGELLDAAAQIVALEVDIDPMLGAFFADVADRAALRWVDIDEGILEVRGGAGHFLYSKLMNWVALDRAVRLAKVLGANDERVAHWVDHRDRVRAAILEQGWSERAGAFTQAFGRDDLDASVLVMPIVGFLPATDPRMRATIEAIADRLTDEHGFVFRYLNEDGLPGSEGTFGICTYWLAECLALAGEVDRARVLFQRITNCANDVGLLSEEVDPATGELLGNFPQAFTHIGLIHTALAIDAASRS